MNGEENIFLSLQSEQAIYNHLFNVLYDPNYESEVSCLEAFSCRILQDETISEKTAKNMLCSGISKYIYILKILEQHNNSFRTIFNAYNGFLQESQLTYYKLTSRCKAVTSTIEKMIELIKQGRSLEDLRDIIGIRLVISRNNNESEKEAQQRLYKICNESIAYFIEMGCIPCNASTLEKKRLQKDIKITVPRQSGILDIYKPYVKDYVFFPKERGYQSLHVVFCTPEGFYVEFQFRTLEMDLNAEHGPANHRNHKEERYSNTISTMLDLEKVQMCGFLYLYKDDNGIEHYVDDSGLLYGRRIFFRDSWNRSY